MRVETQEKLSVISWPCDSGGCGYYRRRFPLTMLGSLGVVTADELSYFFTDVGNTRMYDALALQRQCTQEQADYLQRAVMFRDRSRFSFRVVYDLDDNLHEIHPANPCYDYYNQDKRQWAVKMMELADEVTFSTEPLRQYYQEHHGIDHSVVIKNYLPRCLWGAFSDRDDVPDDTITIMWQGGSSHHGRNNDTEMLRYLVAEVDNAEWVFLGTAPKFVQGRHNVKTIPWQSFFSLPVVMYQVRGDVGLAPLQATLFNECKSDIKLQEFSAVGTPLICSDIGDRGPYRDAPITLPNSPRRWVEKIEELRNDTDYYLQVREEQYEYVNSRWLEDHVGEWLRHFQGH